MEPTEKEKLKSFLMKMIKHTEAMEKKYGRDTLSGAYSEGRKVGFQEVLKHIQ